MIISVDKILDELLIEFICEEERYSGNDLEGEVSKKKELIVRSLFDGFRRFANHSRESFRDNMV